jgi:hypothetical protein
MQFVNHARAERLCMGEVAKESWRVKRGHFE